MSELIGFMNQFKLVGPDGTTRYIGAAVICNPVEVTSGEASATALAGEAVRFDSSAIIPRFEEYTAGTAPDSDIPQTRNIKVLRISAIANVGFIGGLLGDVPAGKVGVAGGAGSIMCIRTVASGSITNNAAGARIIGTATAGAANATTTILGAAETGRTLGILLKPAGTSGGATDTGDNNQIGALVNPGVA